MACSTDQSMFTKLRIVTEKPTEYEKWDPDCEDKIGNRGDWELFVKCPRKGYDAIVEPGEFSLHTPERLTPVIAEDGTKNEYPDKYVIYVCEDFARTIYAGAKKV